MKKNNTKLVSVVGRLTILLCTVLLVGCANMYVDGSTKEITSAQYKKPDQPRPVQALFEFQTKGVSNVRATDYLKTRVIEQVKSSGLFSEISEGPADGGALLSITLNNIPITDDAFSKGFVTGFTFGLAGSQVTDGYVCTARYTNGDSAPAIEKKARHAIHTTIGNTAEPTNAIKAANGDEAVTTMTRQIVSNVLSDLSLDENFQ